MLDARTILMCSGQGSQHYQMAKELFDEDKRFRTYMKALDEIARQELGTSIISHLYNSDRHIGCSFDQILYTHPAIFMIEYALGKSVMDMGVEPDYIWGASLGEIAAATLAGVMSREDGMKLTLAHAELLHKSRSTGGLIAIIDNVDIVRQDKYLEAHCEVAAINSESHLIIAYEESTKTDVLQYLQQSRFTYVVLPVTHGFHSSFFRTTLEELRKVTCLFTYRRPLVPIISCSTANVVENFDVSHIIDVYSRPIRLADAARYIVRKGHFHFIDVGPSSTFANLLKSYVPVGSHSEVHSILTPFGRDIRNLKQLQQKIGVVSQC